MSRAPERLNTPFLFLFPFPAGRKGSQPILSLNYSSSASNGLAGMGWSLGGLPAIVPVRGADGMRFNGSDTYAYASGWGIPTTEDQELVGKGDDRYHLAKNVAGRPFLQFEAGLPACLGEGPCSWIARDGKGTTYKFGTERSSKLLEPDNGAEGQRGTIAWLLQEV